MWTARNRGDGNARLAARDAATVVAFRRQTIVSFHAHPDDEALMTGGTLAMLAAAGHRVVLVTATSGAAGLAADEFSSQTLAARRRQELDCSAAALGVARVVHLDYADSGWTSQSGERTAFSTASVSEAAARLAVILQDEAADILTVYDRHGGYGHPDHVRVHEVGHAAAVLAGTPRVLQATLDRTLFSRAVRMLQTARLLPAGTPVQHIGVWYAGREEITHRVPVRAHATAKRRALQCHASQASGGRGPRTVAILLRLPGPVFRLVCGTEWFIETGAPMPTRALSDPLLSAAPLSAAPRTVERR